MFHFFAVLMLFISPYVFGGGFQGQDVLLANGATCLPHSLREGQKVLAWDVEGNSTLVTSVQVLREVEVESAFKISFEGGSEVVVDSHQLLWQGQSWVQASFLKEQDEVLGVEGPLVIKKILPLKKERLYQVHLEPYHVFILGNGLLIHNFNSETVINLSTLGAIVMVPLAIAYLKEQLTHSHKNQPSALPSEEDGK
jgi:hypothetical protein